MGATSTQKWTEQNLRSFSLTKHLLFDDTIQSPRLESWALTSTLLFPHTKSFWFYLLKMSLVHPIPTTSMTTALAHTFLIITCTQNRLGNDLLSADSPCNLSFKPMLSYTPPHHHLHIQFIVVTISNIYWDLFYVLYLCLSHPQDMAVIIPIFQMARLKLGKIN